MRDIDQPVCGLCCRPGADKRAKWKEGGVYWPGERRSILPTVHTECERAEAERAYYALTRTQRESFLRELQ